MATAAALIAFLAIAGPLAAVLIDSLRRDLEVRYNEREKLIESTGGEIRQLNATIDDLQSQLNLWTGKATPSEFWPPKPDKPPRQILVAQVFDRSDATLGNALRSGKFDGPATARGFLALAALARTAGKTSLAREYFELARDQLLVLRQANPEQLQFARALAECYTQLAHLNAGENREQAAKDLASARQIYERLAAERVYRGDAASQIAWLESELEFATMIGYDAGAQHLSRVAQIKGRLAEKLPNDPDALYRLACYLSQIEPTLSEVPATGKPTAAGSSATLPNE
jgi:hypothetical protein